MSFTYKDIRRMVRTKEKDNNEFTFSDYDIRDAVNEAIRYISGKLADSNADFNEKSRWYDERDYQYKCDTDDKLHHHRPFSFKHDGVPLPDDFMALVAIKGKPHCDEPLTPCLSMNTPQLWEYKISGDRIYCGSPHFTLVYKASIPEVREDMDVIELPNFTKDHFVALVRMILTQAEGDIMRDAVEMVVEALLPKRRYRNAKVAMPFRIGW